MLRDRSQFDIPHVNLDEYKHHEPSVCIPCVSPYTSSSYIQKVFTSAELADVKSIDIVHRFNRRLGNYSIAFIHFHRWHDTPRARHVRGQLFRNIEMKLLYNPPWFWKIRSIGNK